MRSEGISSRKKKTNKASDASNTLGELYIIHIESREGMTAYVHAYKIKEIMHRLFSQESKEACHDINQQGLSLREAAQIPTKLCRCTPIYLRSLLNKSSGNLANLILFVRIHRQEINHHTIQQGISHNLEKEHDLPISRRIGIDSIAEQKTKND